MVPGKTSWYSSLSIKFLTLRPKSSDNPAVCVAIMIFLSGYLPRKYAGNKYELNSLLPILGAILIITRFFLPCTTSSKILASLRWWGPTLKPGYTYLANSMGLSCADLSLWRLSFSSKSSRNNSFSWVVMSFSAIFAAMASSGVRKSRFTRRPGFPL